MNQTPDFETFHQKVGETTVIVPCLTFVLYLDLTDNAGVMDFYARCREALGDRLTHYQAESMKGFAKLNARANAMVPTWFAEPRKGKLNYFMQMAEGDPNEETSACQLELQIYPRAVSEWTGEVKAKELAKRQKAHEEGRIIGPRVASLLRVTLPLDHPLAQPEAFRSWVLDFQLLRLASGFSGYGGYGLNYFDQLVHGSLHYPTQDLLAALLMRYLGFDAAGGAPEPRLLRYRPEPQGFLFLSKRVNWLNLLCNDTVADLGGAEELRARLASDASIVVRNLEHGLLIQAGAVPQIGDVGQHDFIPTYRHVDSVLRPALIDEIDSLGGLRQGRQNEWLRAFEREYE